MTHHLNHLPSKEVFPGFIGKFVHSDSMTFAYWDIKKGSTVPEHSHLHEQVVNMLEGEFELVVEGKPHHLMPGMVYTIPSNAKHSGRAITTCRILDVFTPVREDYR